MRWTDTVKFDQLHPAMNLALDRIEELYLILDVECWITSGNDSTHKVGSKHYDGRALDFRTHNIGNNEAKTSLVEDIKKALGPQFFCQIEDLGEANEHLHVQFNGD